MSGPRRPHCPRCTRPLAACICRWITPLASPVELLILQHPMEVPNAKGSARLLHLSVAGSRMVAGEQFDPMALDAMLHQGGRRPVLLYPATEGVPAEAAELPQAEAMRLVVLDGTWRKSRKMLHLNPALQALPRLPLRGLPASHYRIRKAHTPDQLSTLEAACYALDQLQGAPGHTQALLRAFDDFIRVFLSSEGRLAANSA